MANTYTQLYVHIVFTVKYRERLVHREMKEEIHKYITGIVTAKGQKMLAIHCMPDHIHIFLNFKPSISISELVMHIKSSSSKFINQNYQLSKRFRWQNGFGAFSYAISQIDNVCKYIQNQEKHHSKVSFKNEYKNILSKYEVEYEEKYLFDI